MSTTEAPVVQSAYDQWVTSKELALRWGVQDNTVRKLRVYGGGPAFTKFPFGVRYRMADVLAFEQQGRLIKPRKKGPRTK